MKISAGTQVWVVINNNNEVKGVWNSWHHAELQTLRLQLDPNKNIQVTCYLGGI